MSAAMWRLAPLIGREGVRQPDAMHTKRVTRHLSYANVMATIGVFIALGGASYAAVALPAGSVGPKQLKKSAVAGSKIKRNAISSGKVKDGSLQRGDFASGTLLEGPQGLQGPKGDPGAQGPKGDPGEPGPFPGALPSGKTVRGAFDVEGVAGAGPAVVTGDVSYLYDIPGQHFVHYVQKGTTNPSCPGAEPASAAPGHTCVYEQYVIGTNSRGINFPARSGLGIYAVASTSGAFGVRGTWAATAG
jgi:hypothetical protein